MDTFTGVVTTGIYCRRGCPATPLRRNMLPFGHPAAAEAAGFRPCLRCRPDRVPDQGWIAAPELVCRAMHSIADGALDDATEDELATHLGVSARHLRRLFDEHVGATPSEVARSRRAHFARRLLDDTDLPMTQIATAAGFNTVRQMNRVVQEIFQFTPSELRAKRRRPDRLVVDGGLELRVPYRSPLAWADLLGFLAPRAIPGVEAVHLDTGVYRRVVDLDGAPGVIEVWDEPREQALRLRVHLPEIDNLVHLVAGVRRLFDLDADPKVIDASSRETIACARWYAPARGCASRARSIRSSSVCGRSSASRSRWGARPALAGALVEQLGRPVPGIAPLGLTHVFPSAAKVARADLSNLGLTGARDPRPARLRGRDGERRADPRPRDRPRRDGACSVRAAGHRAVDGELRRDAGLRRARRVPRIGPRAQAGAGRRPRRGAEPWRPWRAYAAMHIWAAHAAEKRAA